MQTRCFTLLFAVLTGVVCAQDIQTSGSTRQTAKDSIRAYYIKHFPDYFFLYPVLKQRSLNFELEKQSGNENLLTFKPNNSYSFGMGMYLFEVGFELAFAIPIDEKSKAIYGDSHARDVQLNVLGKKWGADAFYQRYRGFYVTDSENKIIDNNPYPQRPDIISRNFGVTGSYVFNNQRFSFRSAYNYAERQVFSKGSFLVATTTSSFRIEADSSILNESQKLAFGENVSFTNLRYVTFSIAPGYTYSIVFNNFFLNGALLIGPSQNWIKYKLEGGESKNDSRINSFIGARLSLGYNGERVFGGISFLSQGSIVKFEDVSFSNNNGSFKILIGYRFREFGFLKNRLWDMIPFKI
jgi:hypothetical protein